MKSLLPAASLARVAGFRGWGIPLTGMNAAEKPDNCTTVEPRNFPVHKPGCRKSRQHNGAASAKVMIEILST